MNTTTTNQCCDTPKQEAQQEKYPTTEESTSVPAWMLDAATEICTHVCNSPMDMAKIIKLHAPKERESLKQLTGDSCLHVKVGSGDGLATIRDFTRRLQERVDKLEHHTHDALGLPCSRL